MTTLFNAATTVYLASGLVKRTCHISLAPLQTARLGSVSLNFAIYEGLVLLRTDPAQLLNSPQEGWQGPNQLLVRGGCQLGKRLLVSKFG